MPFIDYFKTSEKEKISYYYAFFNRRNGLSFLQNERQMQNKDRYPDTENQKKFVVIAYTYFNNKVENNLYPQHIVDFYYNNIDNKYWEMTNYIKYLSFAYVANSLFLSRTTSKFIKLSIMLGTGILINFQNKQYRYSVMEKFYLDCLQYEPDNIKKALVTRDHRYFLLSEKN